MDKTFEIFLDDVRNANNIDKEFKDFVEDCQDAVYEDERRMYEC